MLKKRNALTSQLLCPVLSCCAGSFMLLCPVLSCCALFSAVVPSSQLLCPVLFSCCALYFSAVVHQTAGYAEMF
ncbi:hypothetical protein Bpfe_017940, partial [Biomphalaria pfeifferi]